jgi:HPt (histidine-containing phosphotransfer) domain-containing protein
MPWEARVSGSERIVLQPDEDLRPLVPEYLAGLRRDMAVLAAALERGDWEKVRGLAHIFKGLGGSFGCDEVTRLGGLLEEAAKAGRSDPARGLVRELEDCVSRIELAPEC